MLLEAETNKYCPSGNDIGAISNLITWVLNFFSRWSGGYTVKILSGSDKRLMQETILKIGRQYPSHPVDTEMRDV